MVNEDEQDRFASAFAVLEKQPLKDYLADPEPPEILDAALTSFETFYVTDDEKKDRLRSLCYALDRRSSDDSHPGIVHGLAFKSDGDKDVFLLKRVLSLGIDGDLKISNDRRPTHLCSFMGHFQMAKVLFMCRPDLQAKDYRTLRTPVETAKTRGSGGGERVACGSYLDHICLQVAAIWERGSGRFPTIAQLAREQEFWAVLNLVRRGVIPESEKFVKFKGKTAREWAMYHGKMELAEELRFTFGESPSEAAPQATQAECDELKEILGVTVASLTAANETFAEEIASLKEQLAAAKEDVSELKKVMRQNQKKSDEVLASLNGSLRACEEKEGKLMDNVLSLQRDWLKQQELLQSQIKTLQDQMVILPSVISSSVASAAAAFQPAPAERS